ncbi:MAG: hypothetical protein A2007_01695 [Verrucomicrobia bacterium GWC2_42_7]|nr:MAG: hypothetical protein A2007_01695 [Verrucomicrobia bacterium GWC2_42_7]
MERSLLLLIAALFCRNATISIAEILYSDSFDTEITQGRPNTGTNPQTFQNPDVKWDIYARHVYSWDDEIFKDGKHSVRLGQTGGHAMLTLHPLPVQSSNYIQAEAWARTENATGETYIALEFFADGNSVSVAGPRGTEKEIKGGTPRGPIMYLPGSLSGTTDWTLVKVRSRIPAKATHVIVKLIAHGNKTGYVWFDDLVVRQLPKSWGDGEMDRHPISLDPTSLKPDDYTTIKNGHLWYNGERLRVWCAQGNLLADTHHDIDREIARFTDHGFNAYRTLEWGHEVNDRYVRSDDSVQDKLDYIIAALAKRGSFVWMDVLNSCQIRPDMVDVIDDPCTAALWTTSIKKYLGDKKYENSRRALWVVWDPRTIKIYHNYIKQVMAHRNKYNGLAYGEDPAILCWELTNEQWWIMNILWGSHLTLPEYLQKGLYDKWNIWLKQKYKTHKGLVKEWGETIQGESLDAGSVLLLPLLGDTSPNAMAEILGLDIKFRKVQYGPGDLPASRGRDVLKFLNNLLITSKQDAATILKSQGQKGLGCQIVPVIYDTGYSGNVHSLYMHSFADAIACAFYMDMRAWSNDESTFPFASGLKRPPLFHDWIDTRRIAGKPTFIYENMIFAPQKYKAEYCYRLLSWAATQDVDVIDFHYYGHPLWFGEENDRYIMNPLQSVSPSSEWNGVSMRIDEVLMSTVKIAGEIFKQGYLQAASNPTTVTLGSETMWDMTKMNGGQFEEAARRTALNHGFQWRLNPLQEKDTVDGQLSAAADQTNVVSPTRQISYRWKEGILVIDDSHAKVLAGFVPENFSFEDGLRLEHISINTPKGMPFVIENERYATFGLVSQDGKSLDKSAKILISLANTSFNESFEIDLKKFAKDKTYALGLARAITNDGRLPVLVGRVRMTIKATWLKGRSYRMVDYNANVLKKGNCKVGSLTIPNDLPIYLIEISK